MENPRWSREVRIAVALVCFALFMLLLFLALPLVEALAAAALIAYLLNPLVRLVMRRFHLRRATSALLVYVILILIVASLPALLGTVAYSLFQRWGDSLREVIQEGEKWLYRPIIIMGFDISPRTLLLGLQNSLGSALAGLPGGSMGILSGLTTNVLWGLTIVVSLYYFLKDGPMLRPWLVSLAPDSYKPEFDHLLGDLDTVWGLFLRVQLLIFLVLAILFIIGSALAIWMYQMGWLPFSTIGLIVMLIIVYALVQQVDNLWLRPQLLGHQLNLHPGVVFVGLIGALALSGVFGALVVVPLIASAKVVGHYIRCKMLDLPPWPEEPQPVTGEPGTPAA
jgi:predicted PurR-regulated permease PerM